MSVPYAMDAKPARSPFIQSLQGIFQRGLLLSVVVVGFMSALAAGIYWWSEHRHEYFPKRWGVVVPGKIYRSGQIDRQLLEKTFKKHGIMHVIDFQLNDVHDVNQQAEVKYAADAGLKHYRFPLAGDGTGNVESYINAVATMAACARADEPVLVHCAAGTQRTGGVVACYRLLVESADPSGVFAEMESYHWEPEEDTELLHYINTNLPLIAEQLVARGLLDRVPSPMPLLGE